MSKEQTTQQIFRHVFHSNRWGNAESISGPGSTLGATRALLETLPDIFAQLKVKSLVDAPCGDANWIRHLNYEFDDYVGVDIVPELISRLERELGGSNRRFMIGDIATDILPSADAVLCRDCLVHLSFELGLAAANNWAAAGFKYVLATTYPEIQNRDIATGKWRPLNLQSEPFNFPPPIALIGEAKPPKSLGVWRAEDIFNKGSSRNARGAMPPASSTPNAPTPAEATLVVPRPVSPPLKGQRKIARQAVIERLEEIERLWAQKKRRRAASLAEELYRESPDVGRVANFYSWCLLEMRNFERALEITADCFERFKNWPFLDRLCLIQTYLHREKEALDLTEAYFADPELGARALLFHGAVLLRATGEFDPSVDFFHRASRAGNLEADHTSAQRAMLNHEFEALTRAEDNPARNPIHFLNPRPIEADAVVTVSGDETYYRALFDIYNDTFFAHTRKPGHIMHVHLFDPSNDLLGEIGSLAAKAEGRIQFSFERTDGNKSYYYVGRFIQVPRLMARYNCPIIVTDLDCYFKDSIDPMLDVTGGADIGMLQVRRRLCPWRNFLAGLVAFNPTEFGRRYALGIQNFLQNLPSDTNYWYVDQLALAQSFYLGRNTRMGKLEIVNETWRQLCEQGTGKTGQPEVKADRMRKKLGGEAR